VSQPDHQSQHAGPTPRRREASAGASPAGSNRREPGNNTPRSASDVPRQRTKRGETTLLP
jgi:hypothetical protein